MIPIGLRLANNVFPGPEEPIADLQTASLNPEMILDGIDNKDGKTARIKRIVLTRTANVELLRVESPSRIWVRLPNHITDTTLTFREPFELSPKVDIAVGDYAVSPIEDRVYRRCRILKILPFKTLVKIFFIDDASSAWVEPQCLGELPEHFMFFPWQAIQISMLGVYPAVDNVGEKPLWSSSVCDELTKILDEFPILRVEVALSTVVFNDYAKPIAVDLWGIESEVQEKYHSRRSLSIAALLNRKAYSKVILMDLHDAAMHDVFEIAEQETIPDGALEIHRSFPMDWKQVNNEDTEDEKNYNLFSKDSQSVSVESSDWNPRLVSIEMHTVRGLKKKFQFPDTDREPCIMLAVEGKCTKSPFEWYARPIVKTGKNSSGEIVPWKNDNDLKEVDPVDWMIYGNDQLLSFAEQLDSYYSVPKNRKPLEKDEIISMMKEGRDVFAVCAVNEEKAMYTGEWQRVLIVNCEDFAEVRFLDSGGRDMVLTASLYRIHQQHCRMPPMCLRISMHGLTTKKNEKRVDKKWHKTETSRFKMCLREDVPIFINLKDVVPLPFVTDPRPFMAKHVFLTRDAYYMDETKTVRNRFIGLDEGCAAKNENQPVPWPLM